MSNPTLTIQYSDVNVDLVIHAADGTQITIVKAVDTNTPTQTTLERPYLLSSDFRAAVKAGTISIVAPSSPTVDEQRLAVDTMRFLLSSLGPEFITLGLSMLSGEKTLGKQRDAYNVSYTAVKKAIQDGNALEPGTAKLAAAAAALLVPQVEQDAVTAAQADLDQHDADFVTLANNQTIQQSDLDAYLATRKTLEDALAAAQASLDASTDALAAEFSAMTQALEEAAWVMKKLTATDIGSALAWSFTLPSMP